MKNLNILIIGAGIAGLALQRQLSRLHKVRVVEKSPELQTSGTGIMLGINAMQILQRMGLQSTIETAGKPIGRFRLADQNNCSISSISSSASPGVYAIHRGKLHDALCSDPASIHFSTSVESLQRQTQSVDVQFTDGQQQSFDLVIAADGIYSKTRRQLYPDVDLRYSGYTCWRALLPTNSDVDEAVEMWGRGRRCGVVPLGQNKTYVFLVINAREAQYNMDNFSYDEIQKHFAAFAGPVPDILKRLPQAEVLIHNDLYDLPAPLFGEERIVLCGDAAHAATPNLGQGAGMAIEDAWLLSETLAQSNDLHQAIQAFHKRRTKRTQQVISMSHRLGRLAQWESPLATRARNILMRIIPDSINNRQMEKFLLSY